MRLKCRIPKRLRLPLDGRECGHKTRVIGNVPENPWNRTIAKYKVTPSRIVRELSEVAFSNIKDVLKWRTILTKVGTNKDTGEPVYEVVQIVELKSSSKLPRSVTAAISEIQSGKDGVKIKMRDKLPALIALAKMEGMLSEDARELRLLCKEMEKRLGPLRKDAPEAKETPRTIT